ARIAASVARDGEWPRSGVVLAPVVSAQMRTVAEWISAQGFPLRVVAWPALAEHPEELVEVEAYPQRSRVGVPLTGTFGRVVRVVEGAAAVTSAGELRSVGDDHVL